MENKKVALIFLYFIGAIQLVAGVYTQLVGLFHWDFMSLFPVVEMGTQQILYLNLLAVFLVTTLIHIVVAALVNDGSYGRGAGVLPGCVRFVYSCLLYQRGLHCRCARYGRLNKKTDRKGPLCAKHRGPFLCFIYRERVPTAVPLRQYRPRRQKF